MSDELKIWQLELERNAPETYDWLEELKLLPKRKKPFTIRDVVMLWEKSGEDKNERT